MLISLTFRHCALRSSPRGGSTTTGLTTLNSHSSRALMDQVVQKGDEIPWSAALPSFKTQDDDTNSKIIRRMRSNRVNDFRTFFRWILKSSDPMAVTLKERLRESHPQLPSYEDAIGTSAECVSTFPPFW